MSSNVSPLDVPDVFNFVSRLIKAGETNASIVRQLERGMGVETTESALRRFRRRHELNIPGTEPAYTKVSGNDAECLCAPKKVILTDPDRMLKERGLDPKDWYVDAMTVNEWEGLQKGGHNKTKLYQTKFTARRKQPYVGLMPVRSDGWKAPKRGRILILRNQPELVVICGDQQAPFHDKNLHSLFLRWLEENQPHRGVILGDLGDYPDISRHPKDPENLALAQECAQESYNILRDYVTASPSTPWDYLIGNHDERIRQYLLNNAPLMWGLRTVDTHQGPGEEIHSLRHILRLDELGVNLVEPHGTYEHAQVELSKNLAVKHGWIVRQGSGASALKTLDQTGYSIIVGHTHRQSAVYHSQPEMDGTQRTQIAVEAGCMCRIDKRNEFDDKGRRFPNYGSGHVDWQQGFATATIFPDGKFSVDLAKYVNGVLLYRGDRYE